MASLTLHAGLFLLFPGPTIPGSGAPSGRADAPGFPEAIQAVDVRTPEPAANPAAGREARPEEVPRPSRPVVAMARMEPVRVEDVTPSWGSPGSAGAAAPARGATGAAGTGGEAGTGEGTSPPVPRSLLPDWSPPPEVRGHRVVVRVEVDPRGRPTGRVELVPPTPSEDFNRRLRQRMARLEFLPARRDGRPVTAWAEITFTF